MEQDNIVVRNGPTKTVAEEMRGTLDDWWRSVVGTATPVARIKIEIEIGGSQPPGEASTARQPTERKEEVITVTEKPPTLRDGGLQHTESPSRGGAERG
ncbi:MAG: hypothetical protein WAV47_02005 [Blastocatellia bacterium]